MRSGMMQMCPACGRDNRETGRFCAFCRSELLGLLGSGTLLQGRYHILALLGCGGMSAVYLADDTGMSKRHVAIKENRNPTAEAQMHFEREATALTLLRHVNLPTVSDYFVEADTRQYVVMDYIAGDDLAVRIETGPQSEVEVLAWASQIGAALVYLHQQPQPIIHRDIKPANIRLTSDGKVYLVDFSLIKPIDMNRDPTKFTRGMSGIPYLPLEQYGGGHTDERTDLYALAATMYHALTGQPPPEAQQRVKGAAALPAPRSLNPALSTEVDTALVKALGVWPDERFASVTEFLASLTGQPLAISPQPAVPLAPNEIDTASFTQPVSAGPTGSNRGRRLGFAAGGITVGAVGGVLPALISPSPEGDVGTLLRAFLILGIVLFAAMGGIVGLMLARETA